MIMKLWKIRKRPFHHHSLDQKRIVACDYYNTKVDHIYKHINFRKPLVQGQLVINATVIDPEDSEITLTHISPEKDATPRKRLSQLKEYDISAFEDPSASPRRLITIYWWLCSNVYHSSISNISKIFEYLLYSVNIAINCNFCIYFVLLLSTVNVKVLTQCWDGLLHSSCNIVSHVPLFNSNASCC